MKSYPGYPEPPDDKEELLGQVIDHLRRTVRSLAEDITPIGPGWLARERTLSGVWTLNQLRITGPAAVADVVAIAAEHQADLPYRHIVVEHSATALQLQNALEATDWKVERDVLMVLGAPPDREVSTAAVADLSQAQMLALMRLWVVEEHPDIGAPELDQLEEYNRREGRLWDEQCFGALGAGGAPVAVTKLRRDRATAWVEDVYTVPEERGKGYARMLVTHATAMARSGAPDLTFIIADDNNWPKYLYGKIGFRPVGHTWTFHRSAARPEA